MVKIGHTADWHYGYRQYGIKERELDFYKAGDALVDICIKEKLDALIIAGDIFDSPKPPSASVKALQAQIKKLESAGVKVLGVDGNHDATDGNWLGVCGIQDLNVEPAIIGGVKIDGVAYHRPTEFYKKVSQCRECDILVIHQAIAEMAAFATDITGKDTAEHLRDSRTKYVAMGDIHIPKHQTIGDIAFAYPGSLELNSTDEPRDKTMSIVEVDDKGEFKYTYVPIPTRKFLEISLANEEDLDQIIKHVDTYKDSMVIAWYNKDRRDLRDRAEKLLADKDVMHRIAPKTFEDGTLKEAVVKKSFERGTATLQLKNAVSVFFDEGTEQHELVLQLLDQPDHIAETIEDYIQKKEI